MNKKHEKNLVYSCLYYPLPQRSMLTFFRVYIWSSCSTFLLSWPSCSILLISVIAEFGQEKLYTSLCLMTLVYPHRWSSSEPYNTNMWLEEEEIALRRLCTLRASVYLCQFQGQFRLCAWFSCCTWILIILDISPYTFKIL